MDLDPTVLQKDSPSAAMYTCVRTWCCAVNTAEGGFGSRASVTAEYLKRWSPSLHRVDVCILAPGPIPPKPNLPPTTYVHT